MTNSLKSLIPGSFLLSFRQELLIHGRYSRSPLIDSLLFFIPQTLRRVDMTKRNMCKLLEKYLLHICGYSGGICNADDNSVSFNEGCTLYIRSIQLWQEDKYYSTSGKQFFQ